MPMERTGHQIEEGIDVCSQQEGEAVLGEPVTMPAMQSLQNDDGAGVIPARLRRLSLCEIQLVTLDASVVIDGGVHPSDKTLNSSMSSASSFTEHEQAKDKNDGGSHTLAPLEKKSPSWIETVQSWRCGPSEEYCDRHPRRGVIFSTVVYAVPIGFAVLVLQATDATIASKGHLLLAAYSAIRDASSWLGSIFSFFWFFEMASTGKLVGEGDWTRVGGHMVVSTGVSLICGTAAMTALLFLAEPLLHFVSPPEDADAVKAIAIQACYIAAASLPFSVYIFAGAGLLLGAKQIGKTMSLFLLWGCGTAIGIVLALLRLDCRDEEMEFCPEDIKTGFDRIDAMVEDLSQCRRSYAKDGWVCSSYEGFLASSAATLSVCSAGLALSLMACHYHLIAPHRVRLLAAARASDFFAAWSREAAWVAVRSVLGNSRHFVALVVALRMGITQSAAWILFGSVSQLAYAIPSNLSCVAMITISRLIGRGDLPNARSVLNDYRIFGVACGVVFCALAAVGEESIIQSYSKETEEEALRAVIQPVWGWVLAYQPARAMIAVYQSLVAARQAFSFWGKSTAVCFFVVFLPSAVAAALNQDIHILLMGEVLYTTALAALLYLKVHWLSPESVAPEQLEGAGEEGVRRDGDSEEGGGGGAEEEEEEERSLSCRSASSPNPSEARLASVQVAAHGATHADGL